MEWLDMVLSMSTLLTPNQQDNCSRAMYSISDRVAPPYVRVFRRSKLIYDHYELMNGDLDIEKRGRTCLVIF